MAVDRSAFVGILAGGGFVSVPTGSAPDGNTVPVPKPDADRAMDAAACIGCGACVAACPNASATLFVAAKVAHLAQLPQGQPERWDRALAMPAQADAEGFGGCTNHGECEAACPKAIPLQFIGQLNADYLRATLRRGPRAPHASGAAAGRRAPPPAAGPPRARAGAARGPRAPAGAFGLAPSPARR